MSTVGNCFEVFETKEAKKITKSFRTTLNKYNFKLFMKYKTTREFERVALHTIKLNKQDVAMFSVRCVTTKILVLNFDYCNAVNVTNDKVNLIISYVKELGELLNSKIVIIQSVYPNIVNSQTSIPKNDIVLFVTGYNSADKFSYVNLQENFLENYLGIYHGTNDYFEKIYQKDPTFEYHFKIVEQERMVWSYYFKGYEGEIFINIENSLTFNVPSLDIKQENVTPQDLQALLDETFEDSENEVKIQSLIKPPNKHFVRYFLKEVLPGVKAFEKIAEQVFTLLIEDMDAKEIETTIAEESPVDMVVLGGANNYKFVKLFGFYFVMDLQHMNAEKYTDFQTSVKVYEEAILKREHENYTKRISDLKYLVSTIAPK